MLEKLVKSLVEAPVVKKGEYDYFVHPITDGVPLVEADLLQEVAEAVSQFGNLNVDKIVCVEAMGIHLATAISLLLARQTSAPGGKLKKLWRSVKLKNH